MRIALTLNLLAFLVSASIGIYVYRRNSKAGVNRVFGLYGLVNSFWYLATAFQLSAEGPENAALWLNLGIYGNLASLALFAHFNLLLTENKFLRTQPWRAVLLYIPSTALIVVDLFWHVFKAEMVMTRLGWSYIQDLNSPWVAGALVYTFAIVVPVCAELLGWSKRSGNLEHQTQVRIIVGTVSAGLGLYALASAAARLPGMADWGAFSPLLTLIWLSGIAYAIVRYGFLAISPADAAYSIYSTMADGVLLIDRLGIIVSANPAAHDVLRVGQNDLIRHELDKALPGLFAIPVLVDGNQIHDHETSYHSQQGDQVDLSFSLSTIRTKQGEYNGTVLVFRDISERKQTEKRLQHMATHDVLTNLPNRILLNDRLRNAISHASRYNLFIAVLLLDLDRFKEVNDRFGHDIGDLLLVETGRRLSACVRDYDTVSRLGGDEFVVVLADLRNQDDCETVIARIRSSFALPMQLDDVQVTQSLSMGVSLYPQQATTIEDLYKYADIALYQVKATGRNNVQFYARNTDAVSNRRSGIERDLSPALNSGAFELYYQPIIDIATRKPVAMEALIRWNHPQFGLVGPSEFISFAERSGIIVALGEWVIREACKQIAEWQNGPMAVTVTVNLSIKQFQDPALVDKIDRAIRDFKIDPDLLEFELTESTAILDIEKTIETVHRLKNLGLGIIIDDFGSGYSSMTWLKYLEARAVKIDRFFIQNLTHDSADAAIVRAIVSLAHSMGMKVIAEGIETEEQLKALSTMRWESATKFSCDRAQGYLFSKPAPAAVISERFFQKAKTVPEASGTGHAISAKDSASTKSNARTGQSKKPKVVSGRHRPGRNLDKKAFDNPAAGQQKADELKDINDVESDDAVVMEIGREIDLHTFQPKDIASVVEEYLLEAHNKGFVEVRIIHGKGIGYQRDAVRKILSATPFVDRFADDLNGNKGATIAWLKSSGG